MKLHPSNPTPGKIQDYIPPPKPVELREIVDVLDLIIASIRGVGGPFGRRDYYMDAIEKRLKDIKERL